MLCSSLDGRGVWGRMDTRICMAESFCCPHETITTLSIGFAPTQNKKFKKKAFHYWTTTAFTFHYTHTHTHTELTCEHVLQQSLEFWIWKLRHTVQFSRLVVSDSPRSHGLQYARPPCPSPTPRVYPNSCPSSW